MLCGVGTLFFPIAGSALVKAVGFRRAFDMIGIVLLTNALVYLFSVQKDWRSERDERGRLGERDRLLGANN